MTGAGATGATTTGAGFGFATFGDFGVKGLGCLSGAGGGGGGAKAANKAVNFVVSLTLFFERGSPSLYSFLSFLRRRIIRPKSLYTGIGTP